MFKDKNYVYAVYQEHSFSRAAQKLFVSQPTLSAGIRRAEKEVGCTLFDRSSIPVKLTKNGEYYIQKIEEIMRIEEEIVQHFALIASSRNEEIAIGGSSFFCAYILTTLIQSFQTKFPNYKVNLHEARINDLVDKLTNNEIDLMVGIEQSEFRMFESRIIAQEHLILAVPSQNPINVKLSSYRLSFHDVQSGHFLSPEYSAVDMKLFQNEKFLLMKQENDSYTRALDICRDAGFSPKVDMFIDQMLTVYHMTLNGKGISFVRAGIIRHAEYTDKLYFYKIDHPRAFRNVALYNQRSGSLPQVAIDFISFLESEMQIDFLL